MHRAAQRCTDSKRWAIVGREEQGDGFLCALIGRDVARYKRGCRKKHGSSRRSASVHLAVEVAQSKPSEGWPNEGGRL